MDGMDQLEVQQMIDDDLWDSEIETYPITKELYSRTIDSNREDIIDKVEYEEVSIDF